MSCSNKISHVLPTSFVPLNSPDISIFDGSRAGMRLKRAGSKDIQNVYVIPGRAVDKRRPRLLMIFARNLRADQLETDPGPPLEQQLGLPQIVETLR